MAGATMTFGSSNDTWWVKPQGWCVDRSLHEGTTRDDPCVHREMDHFGKLGTGFIWCSTHGECAGTISYAEPL